MSAFLVDGKMITDKEEIRDMWADHFEALVTPLAGMGFDDNFCARITNRVKEIFEICVENPSGVLNEPLIYEEVARVCSRLKSRVSDVIIDYEHIRFGGPSLWQHLFHLYQAFFLNYSVSADLKTGIILQLFKEKGVKADNRDNYRGITMFPTLTKIYEMVMPDRLEKSAGENAHFSNLQFGFQEGVGCLQASFTILESIICLKGVTNILHAFLMFAKPFDAAFLGA